jgi:hypothetical protein
MNALLCNGYVSINEELSEPRSKKSPVVRDYRAFEAFLKTSLFGDDHFTGHFLAFKFERVVIDAGFQ